jgi:phage gpG-like protein
VSSVKVRVNVRGLDRVEGQLRRASYDLLGNVGRRVVKEGQDNAPYKTGSLRADIQIRQRTTNKLTVGTRLVPYAAIHEFGGTIRAKRKPYLHFKVGNRWVRTKQVQIRAKRYMQRAAKKVQGEVNNIARETFKRHGL